MQYLIKIIKKLLQFRILVLGWTNILIDVSIISIGLAYFYIVFFFDIVLSVLLLVTDSGYPFGIFILFLSQPLFS